MDSRMSALSDSETESWHASQVATEVSATRS